MADPQALIVPVSTTSTPSIASAATALAANAARAGWMIQNLGQNPLFVYLATGASTSVFSFILPATTGSANDNGTSGVYSQMFGVVYTGIVTIAGTSPRYVATELTK